MMIDSFKLQESGVKNMYSSFQKEPLSIWSDSRDVMFISINNYRPDIVFIELEKPYNLNPERTYPACLPSTKQAGKILPDSIDYFQLWAVHKKRYAMEVGGWSANYNYCNFFDIHKVK